MERNFSIPVLILTLSWSSLCAGIFSYYLLRKGSSLCLKGSSTGFPLHDRCICYCEYSYACFRFVRALFLQGECVCGNYHATWCTDHTHNYHVTWCANHTHNCHVTWCANHTYILQYCMMCKSHTYHVYCSMYIYHVVCCMYIYIMLLVACIYIMLLITCIYISCCLLHVCWPIAIWG